MLLKPRTISRELRALRSLNARMILPPKDRKHYFNLEKGFQGELLFDEFTARLQNDLFVLNDLLLEVNNHIFQIDTLIITQSIIYPFEVKNYEGDYVFESRSFQSLNKKEIENPLDQLKRSKTLLRQLLQNLRIQLPIEGFVTFVNPAFTLYQAPLNEPIVFPTQINRLMNKLNETPSKLTPLHRKLADQLISLHLNDSPFTRLPSYSYDQLIKRIICSRCYSFMMPLGENKLICERCEYEEDAVSAILRSVEEIKLLFPNIKITTNIVSEWCQIFASKKKISRILKENYSLKGYGQWSYYE